MIEENLDIFRGLELNLEQNYFAEHKLNQYLHHVEYANIVMRISGGTNEYHKALISK